MRPFQLIIIGIFVALAVGGLVLFATFSGGAKSKSVGTVVIWGTLPRAALDTAIADLKTTGKQYSAISYEEHPAAGFDAELANALASGTGPDLVVLSQEQLLAEKGKITLIPFSSVPQRTFLDTYVPIDSLFLSADGTYGVPLVVDPLVLYYNRSLLATAGIATPPATWEAVLGVAPHLTQKSGTQITTSAVALGGYDNIEHARAIISLLFLQSGDSITTSNQQGVRATLTNTDASGVLGSGGAAASAMSFYTQFVDPAKTVYSWNRSLPTARQAFTSGDLALYIGYASELPFLKAANPNLDFDMARIPVPGTAAKRTSYGLAYVLAIPKASKNASGAFLAAQALTADAKLPAIAQALSMAPAKRSLLTPAASDAYAPVYYPEALTATGWLSPAPAVTDTIFAAMIDNITTGRKSVNDALFAANQALDAALTAQ